MGLFEKQGQNAAGAHPLSEWCAVNGINNSVTSGNAITNEMRAWNDCAINGSRPLAVNRSGDISIWEVPEIDGVRESLERDLWDDRGSDEWLELIDHATKPGRLTDIRAARILGLMRRFRGQSDYIHTTLAIGAKAFDTPDLIRHYESALNQVAELTGIDRLA